MTSPESGWLTAAEACRRLKVSRTTLFRLIDRGELPAYRFGRMIRLQVADIDAFLQHRSGEGGDRPP